MCIASTTYNTAASILLFPKGFDTGICLFVVCLYCMFAEGLLIITKVNFTTCVNGDLHGWIKTTLAEKVSSLDQKIHSLWSYDLQSRIESQLADFI